MFPSSSSSSPGWISLEQEDEHPENAKKVNICEELFAVLCFTVLGGCLLTREIQGMMLEAEEGYTVYTPHRAG